MIKLGSLFDGSGGFPLAGVLNGITPLWASEIEKYPIAVTTSRFPNMKHLGDVCGINGGEIEPVDTITFGSPCQDMSIAGARDGLDGNRSSLFYEAIRIIKEMRTATNGTYPRYAVWENVYGAFSSNKGHDFKAVLEAFASVTADTVYGPFHEIKDGKLKWTSAGIVNGEISSIAWRTLDAQYWGVPQRRRRIYLVADFRGHSADKILFDPEGMCGNSAPRGGAREGIAPDAEGSVGGGCWPAISNPLKYGNGHAGMSDGILDCVVMCPDIFHSLTASNAGNVESAQRPNCVSFMAGQGAKARSIADSEHTAPTLRSESGENTVPTVCYDTTAITSPHNRSDPQEGDPCRTLSAQQHPPLAVAIDARNLRTTPESGTLQAKSGGGYSLNYQNPVCYRFRGYGDYVEDGVLSTQWASHDQTTTDMVVLGFQSSQSGVRLCDTHATLDANNGARRQNGVVIHGGRKYIVRRLMPIECFRLMGLPDWWGEVENKKLQSDSAQYKMCGNGIAIPCAYYVLRGIAKHMKGANQ